MGKNLITTDKLKSLIVGSTTKFKLESPLKCETAKVLCYRIPKIYKEFKDRKYSCSIDYSKSEITITVSKV